MLATSPKVPSVAAFSGIIFARPGRDGCVVGWPGVPTGYRASRAVAFRLSAWAAHRRPRQTQPTLYT